MISLLMLLLAHSFVQALPHGQLEARGSSKEPAFTVPVAKLDAAIKCDGNSGGEIVLLVPGTGEQASTFFPDNWGTLLKTYKFGACYLDTPDLSIGDMQITAEYVAYAIKQLTNPEVKGYKKQIKVLSHSQGGSDVQWALTFWPSTRQKVSAFVALGPAWDGTAIGKLATIVRTHVTGKGVASVFQQGTGSNFLKALASHGGHKPLVPTMSIYTATDEIVQPYMSGRLDGGVNIKIQDTCPGYALGHFGLVIDPVATYHALNAIRFGVDRAGSMAKKVGKDICKSSRLEVFKGLGDIKRFTLAVVASTVQTVITGRGNNQLKKEPALMPYAAK
ncbi:hypothetical protein C8J56DRAFT_1159562 [Mycena floridula]|nr:hypothetical protein C8J56DRAFT_1159562 [Mycena floridula]